MLGCRPSSSSVYGVGTRPGSSCVPQPVEYTKRSGSSTRHVIWLEYERFK